MSEEKKTDFFLPEIKFEEYLRLYLDKKHDDLAEKFISILSLNFTDIGDKERIFINLFIETFLYIFIKPDYIIDFKYVKKFIYLNSVISNWVALSFYENTDSHIKILQNYNNSFFKILALYSSRNNITLDTKSFFDTSYEGASLWYFAYFDLKSFPTLLMNNNIVNHIKNIDNRLFPHLNINIPFLTASYYSINYISELKSKINSLIQGLFGGLNIICRPQKHKIAIVSSNWTGSSSIYINFIKSLKDHYHITLIHLGSKEQIKDLETSLFDDVKNFAVIASPQSDEFSLDLASVMENDYELAFYTDIGKTIESIFLSNLRIAPVQITSYGHPVSTFGSKIDYYIGGTDVEVKARAQENYSERLVLIPGIGTYPVYREYKIKNIKNKTDAFIINCSWGAYKFNYEMLLNLKEIIKRADKKVIFRFFAKDELLKDNRFVSFKNEIGLYLPKENTEFYTLVPYEEYMAIMEEGDLGIESYPFGGYNTIVDSLYTGKPVITFEGTAAYNRLSGALMKKLGLNELVAMNQNEYITKIVDIINNDDYRNYLNEKIEKIDLHDKIFDTDEPGYFKKAVDYLIANHWELKDDKIKNPIIIK